MVIPSYLHKGEDLGESRVFSHTSGAHEEGTWGGREGGREGGVSLYSACPEGCWLLLLLVLAS